MASAAKIYTRLTRGSAGVGTYASLWLAADHLMLVRSTGYSENYARLDLRDLKGIFLTQTDRRLWWGIGWGVVAAWSGVVLALTLVNRQTPIFSAIFFVIGAGAFVWNHLLGAGCRAYVLTGVQTAELPALGRMKKARRVVAQLQPLIAAAPADLVVVPPPVVVTAAEPAASAAPPVESPIVDTSPPTA